MLWKVMKVQKFPPDRPCDSLTAGGGKKKNLQTEKKQNAASMLFFLIISSEGFVELARQQAAALAKLTRVFDRIQPY